MQRFGKIPYDGHLQNLWDFPLYVGLLLTKMALLEISLNFESSLLKDSIFWALIFTSDPAEAVCLSNSVGFFVVFPFKDSFYNS